jgi:two-component system NtrC family sensor kinase
MISATNRRVLIVDDMPSIHRDFVKILAPAQATAGLAEMESILLGTTELGNAEIFELDSAYQGMQALEMVVKAKSENRPYAVAIVDMRMLPGWNGIETIDRLQYVDAGLRFVLCSAFADPGWEQALDRLHLRQKLPSLTKPFNPDEVLELVCSLAVQWRAGE